MAELFVYDKAKYHMTGAPGGAPSWEHAAAAPLFFLRWALDRGELGTDFLEENTASLAQVREGTLTLFAFYENACDLVLTSDELSETGDAFAKAYFDYDGGRFLSDLLNTLNLGRKDYPLYTEEAYQRFKPVLESRHASWQKGDIQEVREEQKKSGRTRLKLAVMLPIALTLLVGIYFFFRFFLSR